jgi:anti-anti-sigma factor
MQSAPRVKTTQLFAPPTWIIVLEGDHDLATAEQVSEVIGGVVKSRDPVVVDLSRVTFADSAILRVLLTANERAGRGGLAVVVKPKSQVDRLFNLVDARSILKVFATLARAVAWVHTNDPTPSLRPSGSRTTIPSASPPPSPAPARGWTDGFELSAPAWWD